MGHFRLWLAFSGLLAACGGASTDGLFDPAGAGAAGGNSGAGGSSGSQGFAGVLGVGGSNGVAGAAGVAGVQGFGGAGSGGNAGTDGFGGSGSSGTGGVLGSAGSSGSNGSAGSFSGTGGASTGGSDAGTIDPVDAAVDAGPQCPTGTYAGTLSGPYQSRLGSSQFTARFEFTINTDGATLGKLTATSNPSGKANLAGRLDCSTGNLELLIVEGTYTDVLGTNRYTGTMTATYRAQSRSFPNGQWTATETTASYGGSGTWSANASVSASSP